MGLEIYREILFFYMMPLCIAGKHQRERSVSGDIACSAEAVLEGKNGEHKRGALHRQILVCW